MHQQPDPVHFFFQREMAHVEKMDAALPAGIVITSIENVGVVKGNVSLIAEPPRVLRGQSSSGTPDDFLFVLIPARSNASNRPMVNAPFIWHETGLSGSDDRSW